MIERLGIVTAGQERMERYGHYAYRAPAIPGSAPSRPARMHGGHRSEMLIRVAAEITGVSVDDIKGTSRKRRVAWPRHFAIWFAHNCGPQLSLRKLALRFRRKDHSAMRHALRHLARCQHESPFCVWINDPRAQAVLAKQERARP